MSEIFSISKKAEMQPGARDSGVPWAIALNHYTALPVAHHQMTVNISRSVWFLNTPARLIFFFTISVHKEIYDNQITKVKAIQP